MSLLLCVVITGLPRGAVPNPNPKTNPRSPFPSCRDVAEKYLYCCVRESLDCTQALSLPKPSPASCRDVAEKRKARKGDSGLTGPVDIPEVLLEKLGFPRKTQFQKVR